MPKALPPHPDIDWLKKAAKERLAALRADAPQTKLHQAQLAIAKEYGFASWRALKALIPHRMPMIMMMAKITRIRLPARSG